MFSGSQMGTKLVGPYLANTLGGPLLRRVEREGGFGIDRNRWMRKLRP